MKTFSPLCQPIFCRDEMTAWIRAKAAGGLEWHKIMSPAVFLGDAVKQIHDRGLRNHPEETVGYSSWVSRPRSHLYLFVTEAYFESHCCFPLTFTQRRVSLIIVSWIKYNPWITSALSLGRLSRYVWWAHTCFQCRMIKAWPESPAPLFVDPLRFIWLHWMMMCWTITTFVCVQLVHFKLFFSLTQWEYFSSQANSKRCPL